MEFRLMASNESHYVEHPHTAALKAAERTASGRYDSSLHHATGSVVQIRPAADGFLGSVAHPVDAAVAAAMGQEHPLAASSGGHIPQHQKNPGKQKKEREKHEREKKKREREH